MRAIRKVTSCELLPKQATRNNLIIYKNTYILKLLLNAVTTVIEQGISFCMPVSMKYAACELCHVLTLSINSSLLLKRCDPNQFFRSVNRW
jgi:hypothetical protein